jgi:hypothetical protein
MSVLIAGETGQIKSWDKRPSFPCHLCFRIGLIGPVESLSTPMSTTRLDSTAKEQKKVWALNLKKEKKECLRALLREFST